jgi:hypothetical protein
LKPRSDEVDEERENQVGVSSELLRPLRRCVVKISFFIR